MSKKINKSQPRVSILLNCYNGELYLKKAIDSIIDQTYKNWELVFWDNQSTDKSKKIFKSYKDRRLKYFKSKKHTTLYAARNLAAGKTKGKFLAFIDADDIWEKNKLEVQIKYFRDEEVGVVYGNLWLKQERLKKKKLYLINRIPEGYIYENLIDKYNIGIITAVIRKKLLINNKKIFDDKYNIIGDYDLFLRLAKICKFRAAQRPVATYRIHQKNLSNLNKKLEAQELEVWLNDNKSRLKKKHYRKIKIKVEKLKFIGLKLEDSFFKTFLFFISSVNSIFSLKNIIILLLPKLLLKKIMWFS